MDTCEKYIEYISNREQGLSTGKPGELYSITAVDYYGATEDFLLLQFFAYNCFLYRCTVKEGNPKRMAITDIKSFNHKLQDVYKYYVSDKNVQQQYDEAYFDKDGVCVYDSYYDEHYPELKEYNQRLAKALEEVKLDDQLPVYACGSYIESLDYTGKKAVWYALQQKAVKVIRMERKNGIDYDENRRVFDVKVVRKQPLNTSVDITIADCFGKIGKTVFVPLVDETLDSMFFGTTTWRKILADTGTDMCCQINGVPCRCVQIQMNMDIYNNVFCTTTDENGKTKCTLINNALGVNFESKTTLSKNTSEAPITIEKQKQSDPIPHLTQKPFLKSKPQPQQKPKTEAKPELKPKNKLELTDSALSDSGSSMKTNQGTDSSDFRDDIQERANKHVDIIKDSIGYSFDEIFKQCLTGAEILVLEHSHLSKWFQLFWFEHFIKTCLRVKCFKRFILITNPLEEIDEENHQNIKKTMTRIESQLKKKNILFEIVYMPGCHDRILYTSSDWMATLGYGLDFLQVPTSAEQYAGYDDKECKATKTTYIDFKDNNDFTFKTYDFKLKYTNFPTLL